MSESGKSRYVEAYIARTQVEALVAWIVRQNSPMGGASKVTAMNKNAKNAVKRLRETLDR